MEAFSLFDIVLSNMMESSKGDVSFTHEMILTSSSYSINLLDILDNEAVNFTIVTTTPALLFTKANTILTSTRGDTTVTTGNRLFNKDSH